MNNKEAINTVLTLVESVPVDDVVKCATNMCIIDIKAFGIEEWVDMSSREVVKLFRETAEDTLGELMDEALSRSAGEELLDELLQVEQNHRVDFKAALVGMKEGCIKYFEALEFYLEIHEELKTRYFINN